MSSFINPGFSRFWRVALRIAFYAPLKAPDHPTPSGDRTMARLLVRALEKLGHRVVIASQLRSFSSLPEITRLKMLEDEAKEEIVSLLAEWDGKPGGEVETRPDLWLSYHPYYKAPDLIGPEIASSLAIPYITIEASHARKRSQDAWQLWQAHIETALSAAALNICFTARDRQGLAAFLKDETRLADLPPFLDFSAMAGSGPASISRPDKHPVRLITVAMMRAGDKLKSYQFLAEALASLVELPWQLLIIGDGQARSQVEAYFANFPAQKIIWMGERSEAAIKAALVSADIYLWPGFGEAYGLAYLEAQANSLPVVALDCGGISSVVRHGETGILVPNEDMGNYRAAITTLLENPKQRREMGDKAREFIKQERDIAGAAQRLSALFGTLTRQEEPRGGDHGR